MTQDIKVCRGSWCMAFGFDRMASLDQVIAVLSAFGYDGIELGGFFDHATIERYPDKASRRRLAEQLEAAGLEPAGLAPGPNGDLGRLPWSTAGGEVLEEYKRWFGKYLDLAADLEIPAMRIDPGAVGPLPYDADYDEVWDRVVTTFREHAELGEQVGCRMLWELESGQPFNHPSEVIRLLDDVDHPNFKLLYDTGHFHACCVLGHNQVQPAETLDGGQIELIRKLKGRIGLVHLCDTDGNVALNYFARKLGFGRGIIDFEKLIPELTEVYDGEWWSVDSIPMSSDAWADSYDGVHQLRDMVAKWGVRQPVGA
jgi:sugar phosphate isomerase/epimerase